MSFYASNSESRAKISQLAGGVFYWWWLVGIAGFMLTLMSVRVFQGLGTMLLGLERHFGWSRTAMSGAFALATLTNLTKLNLWGNKISDVSPLANLYNLAFLDLKDNEISDYSPLDNLKTNLEQTRLDGEKN